MDQSYWTEQLHSKWYDLHWTSQSALQSMILPSWKDNSSCEKESPTRAYTALSSLSICCKFPLVWSRDCVLSSRVSYHVVRQDALSPCTSNIRQVRWCQTVSNNYIKIPADVLNMKLWNKWSLVLEPSNKQFDNRNELIHTWAMKNQEYADLNHFRGIPMSYLLDS